DVGPARLPRVVGDENAIAGADGHAGVGEDSVHRVAVARIDLQVLNLPGSGQTGRAIDPGRAVVLGDVDLVAVGRVDRLRVVVARADVGAADGVGIEGPLQVRQGDGGEIIHTAQDS